MASVFNRGTKSSPNWWVKYRDENGKWRSVASGQPNKDAAKTWVATIESRVANGKVGIIEKTAEQVARTTITIQQLFDRFMTEYAPPKVKSIAGYRSQTRAVFNARILPTLKHRTAASITTSDVEQLRDALHSQGYAPGSIQWTLARLSRLYTWARKRGLVDCGNPTSECERPQALPSLDYFTRGEVAALLRHAVEVSLGTYAMIAVGVYCGLRKGELYGLRWSDVHDDAARLDVNRSYKALPKSGKPRYLPIHPELASTLRMWREQCPATTEGLVFPVRDRYGMYRMGKTSDMMALGSLLKAAGCHVPKKPWHALRHTFGSHFMMSRGNILTLQKLLGHSKLEMTLIYSHLSPDFMADEVARMTFIQPVQGVASMDDERRRRAVEAPALGTPVVQSEDAVNATALNQEGIWTAEATCSLRTKG